MAAAASAVLSELDDVTECPICTDIYTDPRVLPCIHTYCLKCIEDWSSRKAVAGRVECPLCRREFAVPSNGFSDLPKNFVVEKLIELRHLHQSNRSDIVGSSDVGVFDVLKDFCSECQENLCQSCKNASRNKSNSTNSHVTLEDGTESSTNFSANSDENLPTYCFNCRAKVKLQASSNYPEVSVGAEGVSCRMAGDVLYLANGIEKLRAMLRNLTEHRTEVVDEICETDADVDESATAEKCQRLKELENLTEELEQRLFAMETFKANAGSLLGATAAAHDVACAASDVKTAAEYDVIDQPVADMRHDDVTSRPHWAAEAENKDMKVSQPKWNCVLSRNMDKPLSAMTLLGNQIFVVGHGNNYVEVYDSVTLTLQRHLPVASAGSQLYGLAACGHNSCLYVSDWDNACIVRLDMDDSVEYVNWLVGNQPAGLSVTDAYNLLVTCHGSGTVQEYTTRGTPVREIVLQVEARLPWQSVQLTSGQLMVTHEGSVHGTCVVGRDGQIERACSTTAGFNYPRSLLVTNDDQIVVADQCNNRILVMNYALTSLNEMSVTADRGLQGPFCLAMDESCHRIFVGEWGGNRLLILENI